MCFKNLPVAFDAQGNAYLKEGITDPYAFRSTSLEDEQDRLKELLARNGYIKSVDFDPVTRVAGALAFHTVVDLESRKVLSGNSMATLFRGYEIILRGRDPRDAAFISSRACGVCGGVHSTTAALAIEMALGLQPPPLAVVVRNMLLSIEYMYDHPLHLFLLAGPDYSQQIVEATNPGLWERARKTSARYSEQHGYATVADLMTDMNPLTGKLYVEALHMTRVAREAYVLIGGKYPHPQTVVPGGMSVTVNIEVLNEFYHRLLQFFVYGQKAAAIWDEITEFFYEADPAYKACGVRPANMIDLGQWDHPDFYDTTYANCDTWGKARWATPGVLLDGEVVTTNLQQINIGLEEFVEHSYYEDWHTNGQRFSTDPLGAPLSPNHPRITASVSSPARQPPTCPRKPGQSRSADHARCAAANASRVSVGTRQRIHLISITPLRAGPPAGST